MFHQLLSEFCVRIKTVSLAVWLLVIKEALYQLQYCTQGHYTSCYHLYTLTNLVQATDIKSECDSKVLSSLLHLRGQSHVKED